MEINSAWVTTHNITALRRVLGRRKLVLASASPRRARVLQQCGVQFVVSPVEVGEQMNPRRSPSGHVVYWAKKKVLAAGEQCRRGLLLGADTIVTYAGLLLGKPTDRKDAKRMLEKLSGRTHTVYTGLAVLVMPQGVMAYGWCTTRVRFHRLSSEKIRRYAASGEPSDKAGAYGIQGEGRSLVAEIDGPLDNVVGLPVGRLAQLIERVKNKLV